MASIGECVNGIELNFWTQFLNQSWKFLNLRKCVKPKTERFKNWKNRVKPTLGEPSNKFLISKLRSKVNLLKRKELHNTGLKQQELK